MLQPKHPRFRKAFKGRVGSGRVLQTLAQGQWGLRAAQGARVTARQMEAARRTLRRHLQRSGQVWRRIFPSMPVSAKPTEVRRGKGKGAVAYWAVRVRPGTRLFEVSGAKADLALRAAAKKFPRATRLCQRADALR
jgi:large subunit ribosomal protein L16